MDTFGGKYGGLAYGAMRGDPGVAVVIVVLDGSGIKVDADKVGALAKSALHSAELAAEPVAELPLQ